MPGRTTSAVVGSAASARAEEAVDELEEALCLDPGFASARDQLNRLRWR